jgi:steroid delta-isomerase-like uncharacterized protein
VADARVEESKAVMREYLEAFWNQGDVDAADRYVASDVVLHDLAESEPPLSPGVAGLKEIHGVFRLAMPDFKLTIDDMIGEDDLVVIRWTGEGTHTGPFMDIPATHKTARFTAISIARIADGKMVEGWQNMDVMGLMQQLGVIPSGKLPAPMKWMIAFKGRREARRRGRA